MFVRAFQYSKMKKNVMKKIAARTFYYYNVIGIGQMKKCAWRARIILLSSFARCARYDSS